MSTTDPTESTGQPEDAPSTSEEPTSVDAAQEEAEAYNAAIDAGAVDPSGAWVPPTPQPRKRPKRRKTLKQWADIYDFEKNPHPYIHKVKAIPMGADPKSGADRPAMNHSQEVLNYFALHLARLGAVFPDDGPYTDDGECEIQYVEPEHGPKVIYNPGTWIDIDATPPTRTTNAPLPKIDLTGVPPDQLDALNAAVQAEKIRLSLAQGADPEARDAALAQLAAEPTMDVTVKPAEEVAADDQPE